MPPPLTLLCSDTKTNSYRGMSATNGLATGCKNELEVGARGQEGAHGGRSARLACMHSPGLWRQSGHVSDPCPLRPDTTIYRPGGDNNSYR